MEILRHYWAANLNLVLKCLLWQSHHCSQFFLLVLLPNGTIYLYNPSWYNQSSLDTGKPLNWLLDVTLAINLLNLGGESMKVFLPHTVHLPVSWVLLFLKFSLSVLTNKNYFRAMRNVFKECVLSTIGWDVFVWGDYRTQSLLWVIFVITHWIIHLCPKSRQIPVL